MLRAMFDDPAAWLGRAALAAALAALVYGVSGGPGWAAASDHALVAAHLERSAAAPLYAMVSGALATLLPVGEPGLRLAFGNALLGALALAGVARAARALLPRDPLAGGAAALLLALAPPFREAAATAGPSMLAACGAVWAVALAAEAARAPSARRAVGALAWAGAAIGAAPWLGALIAILVGAWLARARPADRGALAAATGALGALIAIAWLGARGALPGAASTPAAAIAATGHGAAAIVVGAGLLGAAFAAITGLPSAGWLALAIAAAAGHAAVVDPEPAPLLALLAVGAALVPGALVRVVPPSVREGGARHAAALVAALPLVGIALAMGAARAEAPGDAPARLATDVAGELPPGPGVLVATREPVAAALRYAQAIAGARPDLALAPPVDTAVFEALRRGQLAGADTPAFGRLELRRALPRGRGFQLVADPVTAGAPVPPPARYASAIGAREATLLALARARYEASFGRLDLAARAAGLAERFGAADLALLSVALPTRARPALFGFVPPLAGEPGGPWTLELLGDDLAWVAGLEPPAVDAPAERALHALWRRVWRGELAPTDPAIRALGLPAAIATAQMLAELRPPLP